MIALQKEVNTWQREALPFMPFDAWGKKLVEEANEVHAVIEAGPRSEFHPGLREELADVVIVAMGLADKAGICLEDAIRQKMEKNRARTWKVQDGVVRHD